MFSSFGPLEIALVVLVLLLVFGSKRLPGIGKQLGTGMREFKESITGEDKQQDDPARERPVLSQQAQAPAPPVAPPKAPQPSDVPDQRG